MLTNGLGAHGGFVSGGLGGFVSSAISAVISAVRGAGKRRKRKKSVWDAPRASDYDISAVNRLAIERDKQVLADQMEAHSYKLRMDLAEDSINKRLAAEEKQRQKKKPQRERAFFALEMGAATAEGIRPEHEATATRYAKRKAAAKIKKDDAAAPRKQALKKQRLLNLEKARIAKEKKAKRADEIKKTRLKNLKKARAAKKRKGKK